MEFNITPIGRDTTLRLSCRSGDQFLCLRWANLFDHQPQVRDVWRPKDGEWLLLTSRIADLPSWFSLHPTETSGRAAFDMIQKLKSGYRPDDSIDGPYIWRLLSGDRVTRLLSGDRVTWTGGVWSGEGSTPKKKSSKSARMLWQLRTPTASYQCRSSKRTSLRQTEERR